MLRFQRDKSIIRSILTFPSIRLFILFGFFSYSFCGHDPFADTFSATVKVGLVAEVDNRNSTPTYEKKDLSSPNIEPLVDMYKECHYTRGCLGHPKGCIETRNCLGIVSYVKEGEYVRFEVAGETQKYIAMGISKDDLMGDDAVVQCVREAGDFLVSYVAWNSFDEIRTEANGTVVSTRRNNKRLKSNEIEKVIIESTQSMYYNVQAGIYCTFVMPKKPKIKNISWDLENEEYFLFSARGSKAEDGNGVPGRGRIYRHDVVFRSDVLLKLYDDFGLTLDQKLLNKCHAISMIFIWVVILPVGQFITRYFKETFVDLYICGYKFWYWVHMFTTSLTIFSTIGFAITIYAVGQHYPGMKNGWTFHSGCGVLIMCLLIGQVPLGIAILKFNKGGKHLTVNFVHGFVGHVLFFLGFACIYRTRYMRDGLACDAHDACMLWISTYFILHLMMSYQVCYSDFVQGRDISRVYSLGALDIPDRPPPGTEEPGAMSRKIFLGIFSILSIIYAISLSVHLLNGEKRDCITLEVENSRRFRKPTT